MSHGECAGEVMGKPLCASLHSFCRIKSTFAGFCDMWWQCWPMLCWLLFLLFYLQYSELMWCRKRCVHSRESPRFVCVIFFVSCLDPTALHGIDSISEWKMRCEGLRSFIQEKKRILLGIRDFAMFGTFDLEGIRGIMRCTVGFNFTIRQVL